jgi:hypothetical protein
MKIWARIHTASGISKRSHNGRTQIVASGGRYLNHNLVLILTLLLLLVTLCTPVKANDDDMLRELLEEQSRLEEERMQEDSHQYDDEHIAQQQQERLNQEKLRQDDAIAAQERVLEQERQRIRQQREAAFEANLARMNEDQRKLAQKQKKKDAKIVKKILKAFAKQNYYAVLGLHNLDFTIGPIRFLSYQFGPFTFFRPDAKDIKKAYRGRAMITHPDKNRDGQAHEAFVAVEESAAILADERMRAEYDVFRKQMRLEQQARTMDVIKKVLLVVHQQVSRIIWIFRNLMGPFATPILIIGCLII